MSKVVKTVLIIAVAVAIVVFAPQIGIALAGVLGAAGATVTSILVSTALAVALSATYSLFRKPPSMSAATQDRLNRNITPTCPRKIVFGTTAGGQDERFVEVFGNKKDREGHIIALASHKIEAVKSIHFDTDLTWVNNNIGGSITAHQDGIQSINVVTEGSAANALPLGSTAYWTSASTFTGCAYIRYVFKLDPKAWPSGIPARITAVVDGCPVYDPRRDSSRGGSGSHRADDQSTWRFYEGGTAIGRNPACCLATYLIGWKINGKLAWGMGIPPHAINWDNLRLYANLCEEQVATQFGGYVQRYTCDGIFSTADTHKAVTDGITAAMGSTKLVDTGGLYCLVGGYDDTSGPVIDFTADDLVAAAGGSAPYIWSPASATRDTFNIVRGRFADPNNLYQLADWGEISINPLADGIPRPLQVDLGCVSRPETAQRIAKQMLLREALCSGNFSATFGPKAFCVEVGSLVSLTLPIEGWNRKLFRVAEQAEVHEMYYQMVLREESPTIYAWDKEEKPLPPSIKVPGYDPADVIAPTGLSLASSTRRAA